MTAVFCGNLQAQQPDNNQSRVQALFANDLSRQPGTLVLLDVSDSHSANAWNFVAFTHGNTLGVDIADVDGALRAQLDIPEGVGVVVTGVNPDTAAAKAGLLQHDLVLKAGEQAIHGTKQFHEWLGGQQGNSVTFHVLRKGKPTTVTVALPQTPIYALDYPKQAMAGKMLHWIAVTDDLNVQVEQHYRIGVQLADADDALRSQLRLASGEGLVVTEVLPDTSAAKAGIQKNDVLIKLDGKRLTTVDAINTQVQEIKDRKVSLSLFRGGSEVALELAPRLTSEPDGRYWVAHELQDLILHEAGRQAGVAFERVPLTAAIEIQWPAAVDQIAILKKQLAELQKSLESLEASLQAAPAEKPSPEKPATEEKK
jgi:C-terminal processing protease CtpA/Prc